MTALPVHCLSMKPWWGAPIKDAIPRTVVELWIDRAIELLLDGGVTNVGDCPSQF